MNWEERGKKCSLPTSNVPPRDLFEDQRKTLDTLIKLYRLPCRYLKHGPPEYKAPVSATRNVMFNIADCQVRVVRNKLFLCSKVCIFMNKRHDWQESETINEGTYLDLRNTRL